MFESETLQSADDFVQSIRDYQGMIRRRMEALTTTERLQHPVDYNGAKYKLHNLTYGGEVKVTKWCPEVLEWALAIGATK